MQHDQSIQKQAQIYDSMRTLFARYASFDDRPPLYKLICIHSSLASIREKVSEAPQGLTRLQFWLMQLELIHNNQDVQTPEASWLKELINIYHLPISSLQRWIIARQKEYTPMPINNLDDWWAYMENTGGLTAQFWQQIINPESTEDHLKHARNMGAVWAAIGCLRSVGFHRYIRLQLLPKELLYKHGFILPDGWLASSGDNLEPVFKDIVFSIKEHMESISPQILPLSLSLHLSAAYPLLKQFEQKQYNPFHPSWAQVPKKTYWKILQKAALFKITHH